ncbi:MAG: bifunctional methylenetetrahydrofolate dehydrogenase/methenyltetrahydrofolate cyclohydrolase FolD [Alphaproteobacteria bacterium]|nr:bifunctional methylenetetrahydrofolate dehydrogenase/methenyltetrahydrofolate cyclohydrolase FolD [Alphaproteobacteria bacterium]
MTDTQIIDGKTISAALRATLKTQIDFMPVKPGLAVILVGDDPASHVYVRNKIKACAEAGIRSFESRLPVQALQAEVAAEIKAFNANPDVHGILLQLPAPAHLDSAALIQMIAPHKDVDGLSFINQGKLLSGDESGLVPCTPQGALRLIQSVETALSGKHAVIIGRSLLFGKPMAQLLLAQDCTVTTAHSRTRDLPALCRNADILVAAVGRPEMVKGDWLKPGAIVVDVGINRLESGKLTGDVDFEAALGKVRAITPVPGGVGPMTIACLLTNTLKAAQAGHST